MKSRVMAINALSKPLLLVNRDNPLNEKAYQRALAQNSTQTHQVISLYSASVFQPSSDMSLQQLMIEKLSRQCVVEMQNQLNECRSQNAESLMY